MTSSMLDKQTIVDFLNKKKTEFVKDNKFYIASEIRDLIQKINLGEFDRKTDCTVTTTDNDDLITVDMSENGLKEPICIYSEEAKKSEWKPKNGEIYYHPVYEYGEYKIKTEVMWCSPWEYICIDKGEAFKTEKACKEYMNAKGWYNDKPWEV